MRVRYLAAVSLLASVAQAQVYDFTLTPASSATWNLSVSAPFVTSGDPRSTILGNYDAVTNPGGTRTLPGLIGSDNGLNNPINISSGSVSASGNSGSNPLHPAGAFRMGFDVGAGQAAMSGWNADILNESVVGVDASVNLSYPSFRTRVPTCTLLGLPLTIPLGSGSLTVLTGQQTADAGGTLTATAQPNQYDFTIPFTALFTIEASFAGQPVDTVPQEIPLVLAGTVTINGDTASITASTSIDQTQTEPGPIPLDPVPFDEPLCGGHLVFNLILSQIGVHLQSQVSISANGALVPSSCDPDYDQNGVADQDDVAYLVNVIAGGANPTGRDPDFNQDGVADQDDYAALVNVVAGGACP